MGGYVFYENMSCGRIFLQVGISYLRMCLLEDVSNRRTGLSGGYV